MIAANQKISIRQLQILIILNAMGAGLIVLPRRAAEYAGADSWLVVIGLTVLGMIFSLLLTTAAAKMPDASFMAYAGRLFSKPLAYLLGFGLWIRLILGAGLEIRLFTTVTREFLLDSTPFMVISLAMLLVCAYAAMKGIETRARAAEVLIIILLIVLVYFTVAALFDIDFSNLRPVLAASPKIMAKGTLKLGYMFAGMECLLLVAPFINKHRPKCPNDAAGIFAADSEFQNRLAMQKPVAAAVGCAGVIILIFTVLTTAKFGAGEVLHQPWPVLRMMDMLNLPGSFIARQDALMMSFWIISVFALCNAYLFFSAVLARDMVKGRLTHSTVVLVCAVLALGVSSLPIHGQRIFYWLDRIYFTFGIFYLFIFPLAVIGFAKIRRIKAFAMIIALLLLAGCWDKIEIEDRAFAMAIGVDKAEKPNDHFTVTISIPELKQGEKAASGSMVQKADGATVAEALFKLDAKMPQKIFLSQAKVLALDIDLLSDAGMFKKAMDALDKNMEIDRQILVVAGDVNKILDDKKEEDGATMPGLAIADKFKNKSKKSGLSFKQDFSDLCATMRSAGDGLIPLMTDGVLSGAVVMKDYKKTGELDNTGLRGYLWGLRQECVGNVITAKVDEYTVPMTVKKHRAKIRFTEKDGRLVCHYEVGIDGKLGEFSFGERPHSESTLENLKRCYEQQVKDEITNTMNKMQWEYHVDGYRLKEELRKNHYALYKKYSGGWERAFMEMEVIPQVRVQIK